MSPLPILIRDIYSADNIVHSCQVRRSALIRCENAEQCGQNNIVLGCYIEGSIFCCVCCQIRRTTSSADRIDQLQLPQTNWQLV